MRLLSIFAVATLSIASLVACSATTSEEDPAGEVETEDGEAAEIKAAVFDEGDNNKTVSVTLGRSFAIALSDNASTGFQWNVKSVDRTIGQPKVTQVPGDSDRPGSAGLKKFTWATKSPLDLVGKHTIVLEHARSFSKAGATTFTITIDIKKPAPSATTCGGLIGKQCGADSYCDFTAKARCGIADQTGKCDERPQFCAAVILPVCGCDGKTYSNSCVANRSGVSVASAGKCTKK
jgi:predicted secreted protein